jgi:hypothetical protein
MLTLFPTSLAPEQAEAIRTNLLTSLKSVAGVVAITISDGPLMSPGGAPAYTMVVEVHWETLDAMMAWTQLPGAQQGDKDVMLANGGVLVFYEAKDG